MRGWCSRSLFLVVLVVLVVGCSQQKKSDAPPIEGNPAPEFTLKDMTGREISLSSLKGKVVLVNFWATWCPPCREEIPSMMRLNKAMQGEKFQMLAISVNEGGKGEVEAFFKKSAQVLPALLDADQAVSKRYGITGVPESFLLDKKGTIVKKVVGPMDWDDPAVIKEIGELAKK